jgi:hypothetical protein
MEIAIVFLEIGIHVLEPLFNEISTTHTAPAPEQRSSNVPKH